MGKRSVIKIDESLCDGCGLCLPKCPEGALKVIDGKARLVSDLFCDGLGACLGHCPRGAISVEIRDAGSYDERQVMGNIVKQGPATIRAHLNHLREHGENEYLRQALEVVKAKGILLEDEKDASSKSGCGCPGARMMDFRSDGSLERKGVSETLASAQPSELRQWPAQLVLVAPNAPYLRGCDLLISADCVPFAYADFHRNLLKGKTLLVACPKLDDRQSYAEKVRQIIKNNEFRSVTYARMEVACCSGLVDVIKEALEEAGKAAVPFQEVIISVRGERIK